MLLSNDSSERKKKVITWKYYNHAVIPKTAPHEEPDTTPVLDGSVWKTVEGKAFLARWVTDFDCGYETQWWYCIKDTPYDPMTLNSKKRYNITKGKKYFDVRVIDPMEYREELYEIAIDAYSGWPKEYRPSINKEGFLESVERWKAPEVVLGAFSKELGVLCGFVLLTEYATYVSYNATWTKPSYEKLRINAALVAGICEYYNKRLSSGDGFYISDGARNILHKTAFQDYLEENFGFRKAYCRLHIFYRKPFGMLVGVLMPVRKILYKLDRVGFISKINGILRMEEICRSQTAQK